MITIEKYGTREVRPDGTEVESFKFRGLSTDTKPTEWEGCLVRNGSEFEEIDSGNEYRFDAESNNWNKITRSDFESAADLANTIRSGAAADQCEYGDLITVSRTTSDNVTKSYDWEIIGINEDEENTLTLNLHNAWDEFMVMGEEALAVFPEGLAVGHYSITLPASDALFLEDDVTMYFPIGTAIPAGGKLLFTGTALHSCRADNTIIQRCIQYRSTGTTGQTYTDLGTADGTETNINKVERAVLGSNDYENSPLRAWLNDDRPAAERDLDPWVPANIFSIKPKSMDGFLYGWEEDFADMITEGAKRVFRTTSMSNSAYIGTITTLEDKAWLLAYEEVGYEYPGTIASPEGLTYVEGEKYGYFDQFDKIKLTKSGMAVSCLLRTEDQIHDSYLVYGDDERTSDNAVNAFVPGIAPCVIIS